MSKRDEEPTGAEQVADSPRERRLELVVTILLASAALLSAWGAYQSARFSSKENAGHAEAIRLQVDATAADNAVSGLMMIDVTAFAGGSTPPHLVIRTGRASFASGFATR